jgi:hypothetical protein
MPAWDLLDDMLTLCPTGLSPPVYRDQLDYEVIEDGLVIGRIYEDHFWRTGRPSKRLHSRLHPA